MTATPIPRTLALTLYGDLEVRVIDEMPPGRTPIVTRRTTDERAPEVWEFVRKQVAQGRQAYLVYPVIEGATRRPAGAGLRAGRRGAGAAWARRQREESRNQNEGQDREALCPRTKLRSAAEMYDELAPAR